MENGVFLIERFGLFAIFVNVLLSSGGLPLPCYPMLMLAAALAAPTGIRIPEIVATGAVATLIADSAWFWGGRRYGGTVLKLLCRISLSPDSCVRRTETVFTRVGPASVALAKFVPGLSNISVALAGATGIAWPTFLLFDAAGAVGFIGAGVALGTFFRRAIAAGLGALDRLGEWGIVFIVAALSAFLVWKWLQRQWFLRQLRVDRVTVAELRAMIEAGTRPTILDVRSAESRARGARIPGSIAADALEQIRPSLSRDVEIIVYCACPNEASAALLANELRRAGFRSVRPLLGGIDAWVEAGLATEAGAKPLTSKCSKPCIDGPNMAQAA
ncbi:MAG TPA: DedA family protein/thiosulfate sulfurtransferase GlpE [Rhizomicrobium sp.]|nr:DedA family protein/thiosulfate sulfurtransferase GlpE [Rhizomicrobium sp.]